MPVITLEDLIFNFAMTEGTALPLRVEEKGGIFATERIPEGETAAARQA
jgi:hypothetical protein